MSFFDQKLKKFLYKFMQHDKETNKDFDKSCFHLYHITCLPLLMPKHVITLVFKIVNYVKFYLIPYDQSPNNVQHFLETIC